jgi:hypothetical protein
MLSLQLWMRIAGSLYLIMCAAALTGTPIRAEGPSGVMERAAAGDATARFLVNTWITLGLLLGVLGAALWYFRPRRSRLAHWRGRRWPSNWGGASRLTSSRSRGGQMKAPSIVWIVIHLAVAGTGLAALGVFATAV